MLNQKGFRVNHSDSERRFFGRAPSKQKRGPPAGRGSEHRLRLPLSLTPGGWCWRRPVRKVHRPPGPMADTPTKPEVGVAGCERAEREKRGSWLGLPLSPFAAGHTAAHGIPACMRLGRGGRLTTAWRGAHPSIATNQRQLVRMEARQQRGNCMCAQCRRKAAPAGPRRCPQPSRRSRRARRRLAQDVRARWVDDIDRHACTHAHACMHACMFMHAFGRVCLCPMHVPALMRHAAWCMRMLARAALELHACVTASRRPTSAAPSASAPAPADPGCTWSQDREQPLHQAARRGQLEVVRALLNFNVDKNAESVVSACCTRAGGHSCMHARTTWRQRSTAAAPVVQVVPEWKGTHHVVAKRGGPCWQRAKTQPSRSTPAP